MRLPDRRGVAQWAGILAALALVAWAMWAVERQAARVDALAAALEAEQAAAEDRGETPVAPAPDDIIDDPAVGPAGPAGPPGTDGDDGRGLVDVECRDGEWLVSYTDGSTALAGDCTGDEGPQGVPGVGQPGPAGPSGPPGASGDDGRGIDSIECVAETGRWRVTYDDGDVVDDAGPCVWTPGR